MLEHAMKTYCAGAAAQKKLRVSIQVIATETHILADSSRITQVFWNLLQNACKFTPESGEIYVRVYNEFAGSRSAGPEHAGPDLIVEIRDTGIGISPEEMPRIFNAFEQGERSRTRVFGGLGLGLAISRAIVELHDGSITAVSEGRNKGAKFIIRLQTVESAAVANDGLSFGGTAAAALSSRALRILLVEDHPDTAQQLTRLLKRAGHDVTWAGTINQARALIDGSDNAERGFNILISDLGLPDGSGHDLMRDLASRQAMPGIALSGYGMKDDILDSMAAGFSRHLTKPVDWQELKVAIQKIAAEQDA